MKSCLCLTSTTAFEGSLFNEFTDGRTLDVNHATFVTASGRENFRKAVGDRKFDTAFSHAEGPRHHSSTLISQIASCLRPGGVAKVSEPEVGNGSSRRITLLFVVLVEAE